MSALTGRHSRIGFASPQHRLSILLHHRYLATYCIYIASREATPCSCVRVGVCVSVYGRLTIHTLVVRSGPASLHRIATPRRSLSPHAIPSRCILFWLSVPTSHGQRPLPSPHQMTTTDNLLPIRERSSPTVRTVFPHHFVSDLFRHQPHATYTYLNSTTTVGTLITTDLLPFFSHPDVMLRFLSYGT